MKHEGIRHGLQDTLSSRFPWLIPLSHDDEHVSHHLFWFSRFPIFIKTESGMRILDQHKTTFAFQVALSRLLLAVFVLSQLSIVRSQPADVQFDHLTTYEGLSQDIVKTIFQDKFGFLWIGTEDGLNRYDGYTIKTYKNIPGDSTSLPGRVILGICDYGDDGLLVAMENGLSIYDRASDNFARPRGALEPFAQSTCYGPIEDHNGHYWLIVGGTKLLRYDRREDRITTMEPSTESRSSALASVFLDRTDSLWIATDSSLALFLGDQLGFQHYPIRRPGTNAKVTALCITEDRHRDLWIGTTEGLYLFDRKSRTSTFVPLGISRSGNALDRGIITSLGWDRRQRLWIGSFNGLFCLDTDNHRAVLYSPDADDKTSISSFRIYDLYIDPSDVLWVGGWNGGLNKADFKKERFGHIRNSPHTPFAGNSDVVSTVYEDVYGNVWLGGNSSEVTKIALSSNEYTHFFHHPRDSRSISTGDLACIVGDSTGVVWLATNSMLNKYEPKTKSFRRINVWPEGYPAGSILTIFLDRSGFLWIGTDAYGVERYDPRSGTFAQYNSLGSDTTYRRITSAWSFFQDRMGYLWIGGWQGNGNLHRLDTQTGKLVSYPQPQLRDVRSMYEDDQGNLWVGTWGVGMSRFTPSTGQVRQFTEQSGLPNNFVKGVLPDDRGNLWISTERGLSRFSMKSETFRNFSIRDGVQGNHFYSGSCWKGHDGRLYFGGENGLNAFYPDSITDEEFNPPVCITALRIVDQPRARGKTFSSTDAIVLTHEETMFSFDFVALDYSAPERNQYAYRLEGFNDNWTESGTRRYASYTHLDPGEYHFVVKGTNSDGMWSNRTADVRIIILPAYWQTWWFRSGLMAAVISLLYGLYRYRLNKLLEIERTRSAIATDLHDDIGASLTSIALFSDLARKEITSNPSQAIERLHRIADSSRMLLDKMNDIVW